MPIPKLSAYFYRNGMLMAKHRSRAIVPQHRGVATCHFLQLFSPELRVPLDLSGQAAPRADEGARASPTRAAIAESSSYASRDKGTRMRILVVDDHPLIQVALKFVLEELDASLSLFPAHDAPAARSVLAVAPEVDLIVLDLTLPGCDGFDFLRELRRDWPGIPVLVLSATHDRATIEAALDMGAMGFIPKTANARQLIDALRLVLAGGIYV